MAVHIAPDPTYSTQDYYSRAAFISFRVRLLYEGGDSSRAASNYGICKLQHINMSNNFTLLLCINTYVEFDVVHVLLQK